MSYTFLVLGKKSGKIESLVDSTSLDFALLDVSDDEMLVSLDELTYKLLSACHGHINLAIKKLTDIRDKIDNILELEENNK